MKADPRKMKTVAIIQARMGSTRLPGKVLVDVCGQPLLVRVVARTRRAACLDEVVVATSLDASDDPVAQLCKDRGFLCVRGSAEDVLDRFYQAARTHHADIIVRITADCPLIDPGLIDLTVSEFKRSHADFAANRLPPPWHRTYPKGLDVEVCSFPALERAWREADQRYQREHVMPYFYEKEGLFSVFILENAEDQGDFRWSVDVEDDLRFVREVYRRFKGRDDFSWQAIVALLEREPALSDINRHVSQKTVFEP